MFQLGPIATTAIVASIGSVGLWKVVGLILQRVWKREDSENDRLRAELATEKAGHAECMGRLDELERRIAVIEHHHSSYLPRWIKDSTKRVLWINDKAFISIFAMLGLKREDVIGKTFADLLLDPVALAEIDRLEMAALAHHGLAASNVIRLHPLLPVMVVVKVADVGRDGELIFEGYAYMTNDRMIVAGMGAERQQLAIAASADHMMGGDAAAD